MFTFLQYAQDSKAKTVLVLELEASFSAQLPAHFMTSSCLPKDAAENISYAQRLWRTWVGL